MTRAARFGPPAACLLLAGCLSDDWVGGKSVNGITSKVVDTSKAPPVAVEAARRVDTLGHQILEQNPFTGLDPLFTTIHCTNPVAFHRGVGQVFVSDGLVKRCETDAELAAVLCSELGQMMAEQRAARAVGVELKSIPDLPGGEKPDPAADPEPVSAAKPKPDAPSEPADAGELTRDLMRGSGFDPATLEKTAPLRRDAARHAAPFERSMAGPSTAPRWNP